MNSLAQTVIRAKQIMKLRSFLLCLSSCTTMVGARVPPIKDPDNIYYMPAEEEPHEGTWLQWPHDYGWDRRHVARYEESWIQLTHALHQGERVHIIAYDWYEKNRIQQVLSERDLDMSRIDIYQFPTDDVWVRDNGPIFVFDKHGHLRVEDWKFNGWGYKADFYYDDYIPVDVAHVTGLPRTKVKMTNEGGSVEVDGNGTLMAKRSSILNRNRNRGWKQDDAERYFRRYLGVTNFIWLDGEKGLDITDDHIDGTARFANGDTIVTYHREDFLTPSEYDVLSNAKNANGEPYKLVHLPVTQTKVPGVNDFGIYINFYVGNGVVVVPIFDDPSDAAAKQVLQDLFPSRDVVGIDFVELYKDGGLVHCVTQQQPLAAR